jgi:putative flippase GtrA
VNRTIALFVALVILLAHCLAIHTDGQGHFAFPYDQAYVPLRLAHNLVFEGQLRWNPGTSAWESYDSPLWVAIAAVAERLSGTRIGDHMELSSNVIVQATSVLAALLTVILAAQLRGDRTAGLIAPLLLVTCGCFAAAAASGLETSMFALLVITSFWTFERRFGNRLAIAMVLLCLTRPEGAYVAVLLLLLRTFGFRSGSPRPALWPFIAPVVTIAATTYARYRATGFLLPPSTYAILHPLAGQLGEGVVWLGDSARTAISLVLLVYAFVSLARGHISGMGARALFLALVLVAVIVPQGRGPLPFAEALVPVLPLAFVAVQEGMIESLDGTSVLGRRLALSSLFACLFVSAFVSRHPADLGPLPLEEWHERWMRSRGSARFGYEQPLGRLGLEEEIDTTIRLRGLGIFLRDFLDPGSSVLTAAPGAVGYLSRLPVIDLLGRASPVTGKNRPAAWTRRERADVVAALAMNPDYVIEQIKPSASAPALREVAGAWLEALDDRPNEKGRLEAIETGFSNYEMIAVPIRFAPRGSAPPRNEPFFLLRRRDLAQRPVLRISIEGRGIRIQTTQPAHMQIADLRVEAIDARGRTWSVRPTGDLVEGAGALARPDLLLYNSGTRPVELYRGTLPARIDGADLVEVRAVLRNPGASDENAFSDASDEVVARL